MRATLRSGLLLLLVHALAPGASAQAVRGSIGINGGYQATTTEFDDSFTFPLHQETGTTRVTYPIGAGPVFDAGGGVRLWRGLGAGLAVSRFVREGRAPATTLVPHPFFLQRHRQVAGDAAGIRREETGIHLHAQYSVPLSRRLYLTLMAGPSMLRVDQTLVIDVNYSEEYPYDDAAFTGADTNTRDGSAFGFNVGADVRWMFTRTIGAGGFVRFTRGDIELEQGERTLRVDAGGAQAGAGVRFVF
jgi:hypothetical protein